MIGIAGSDDKGHPIRGAAGREADALPGCRVEPLSVVDDDQHRPGASGDPQQAHRRHAHRQPVARRRWPERERRGQRGRLRRRKLRQSVQHRREQIGQGGEREIGLGLHARNMQDRDVTAARAHQLGQQGGLADPGLAAQQQGASVSVTQLGHELSEPDELDVSSLQHEL